jgi:SAM-dependent methyltransferase
VTLQIHGDVRQPFAPDGLYDDGWSNGALRVSVEPARDMEGFVVEGLIPEWWPPDSSIAIEVDGRTILQHDTIPGTFALDCSVPLYSGTSSTILVRTSTTAYDPSQDRYLGAYVAGLIFREAKSLQFRCNVCGTWGTLDLEGNLDPEGAICGGCSSNIRVRKVAQLVSDALFGRTFVLNEFPETPGVLALGISDSPAYAEFLKRAVPGYTNTQFDRALVNETTPFFDVVHPSTEFIGIADFVTCSEVLEHIEPPVQRAFDGLYSVLRPGGTLILTVPYTLERTVEHFPDLYQWRITRRGAKRVLMNRTRDGETQEFTNLRFHGGGADVLEMRVFGFEDILEHLKAAGFTDVRVHNENAPQHGIYLKYNWGLPFTARRPSK